MTLDETHQRLLKCKVLWDEILDGDFGYLTPHELFILRNGHKELLRIIELIEKHIEHAKGQP